VIDAVRFSKLWETFGVANPEGFKITRVTKGGVEYRIDVVDAELQLKYLRSPVTGPIFARGYNVAGTVIEIEGPNQEPYRLVVGTVGQYEFWAKPLTYFAAPPMTWTYKLYWYDPNVTPPSPVTGPQMYPVCGENVAQDGMADFTAVLVDDENIDRPKLRVYAEQPNSFLIGCAGHAIAKQHLTGHTKAASHYLLWTTTINQRTANLKMITGDYCGNGNPFTVAGEKIKWQDEWSYYNTVDDPAYFPMTKVLEARWDENGATCLNEPRVNYKPNDKANEVYPDGVSDDMAEWCTGHFPIPPPCTGTYADMQGAHVISVNWKYSITPL
jgi:hypothetical protein